MYSLFAFIGIVSGVAALYASLYASKVKYNKGAIILVIYATALGCICGAWLTDNVAHFIAGEPFGFGGISANGGIIGALVTCYFSCVIIFGDKNSARFFINEVIPSVTLIHAFGRIGCYFGGRVAACLCGSILPFISPSQFTAILFVVFATVLLTVRKIKGDQGIIIPQYLPNAVKDKRRKRRGETDE